MIAESVVTPTEVERAENPFPGLRPFEFHENHLFFGRDGQSEELLVKLSKTHFLAVVGTSGSGKSSLVRAGLLPALYGGLMGKSGSGWRIAILRPGNDPIGNLAEALNKPGALEVEDPESRYVQTRVNLRRGSLGLAESVRQARLMAHENLLVVVDQFEELFRFGRISEDEEYANDAAAFVKLLLEAKRQSNIYVVLTMRSDYLGDCAQFWDLPEAINEGQYLIPRMTRDERREAILGPLGICGATITSGLVNQLLNDMGDRPDQLPILQHALMRIWEKWREDGDASKPLDLCHYERSGGLCDTLSRHADEAYAELPDARSREIAEKLFKCLTEKGTDDRETRRPTELREICQILGASMDEVVAVIDVFRREGRSFLMPPANIQLEPDSLIDISHESLIRGWQRLRKWVEEETSSHRLYRRLADNAILYREEGTLRDPGLQETLDWRERDKPNEAWASRHHTSFYRLPQYAEKHKKDCDAEIFRRAMSLLDESKRVRDIELEEKERHRRRRVRRKFIQILTAICSAAFVVCLIFLWFAIDQRDKAMQQMTTNRHIRYAAIMNLAQQAANSGDFARANKLLNDFTSDTDRDLRSFEWLYLWKFCHNERATLRADAPSEVLSVAYSTDGTKAAAGKADGSVTVWDTTTSPWQVKAIQKQHTDRVLTVAFSSEGLLATGSADSTVKLWAAETGELLKTLRTQPGPISSVAFSPDGKRLVSVTGGAVQASGAVRLWGINKEANSFEPLPMQWNDSPIDSNIAIACVTFSPDGKMLAVGGKTPNQQNGDTVKIGFIDEGRVISLKKALGNEILSVAFSPDSKMLAIGGIDKDVRVWDISLHQELTPSGRRDDSSVASPVQPFRHENKISSVQFSRDGKWLASGSWDGTIKLWSVDALRQKGGNTQDGGQAPEAALFVGHAGYVNSIAFAEDNETLISGSDDRTLKLWDVKARPTKETLSQDDPDLLSLAFSPDGATLAAGTVDGRVKLWKFGNEHQEEQAFTSLNKHERPVASVTFSRNGKLLATGGLDGNIWLWDTSTWQQIRKLEGPLRSVRSVAFSPDGALIAAGYDDSNIRLWDAGTGQPLKTIKAHKEEVLAIAFSPMDANILASGSADRTVKLWDVREGREFKSVSLSNSVLSIAFSPDAKMLAIGASDGTISLLKMRTLEELEIGRGHANAVSSVLFSPDGKRLASGSYDGVVKLWDTTLAPDGSMVWQELISLNWRLITSMAFSPDYRTLVTGSPTAKVAESGRDNRAMKIWYAASPEEAGVGVK